MRADLTLVETRSVNMFPVYNPYSALVYSANASNVEAVMTGGVLRVKEGRLTQIDLPALRETLSRAMTAFTASAAQYADII